MCRLAAITSTDIEPQTKKALMHFMMVASAGDDNQVYGAGVSDGDAIFKSGQSYINADGLSWLGELDPRAPWIGHVRKPSANTTGADSEAAHPYACDNSGNAFVGIHNGWVAGTTGWRKDAPDTDSWRAFKALERLAAGALLDQPLIQRWLQTFESGTSSSFLLVQDGQLIGVRGLRTLYRFKLHNGWVINTSHAVIANVHAYAALFMLPIERIEELPEGTYIDTAGKVTRLDLTLRAARHETPVVWQRKKGRNHNG